MISKQLLDILVCPDNQSSLRLADEALLAKLNAAIAGRWLRNRAGHTLEKPLDGGLVREDGQRLYPIIDGIPVLLVDEAIELEQVSGAAK